MKHIPNFITSLNLTAGFIALIYASNGDLFTASLLILAAMIFDFFDGMSARLLKAYSEIGKELDSLADIVSFGVAPGIIIFRMLESSLADLIAVNDSSAIAIKVIVFAISALMPVCAALRLAIFNIDTTQTTSFKGLPTPANALAVISLVLAGHFSDNGFVSKITGSPVILGIFTIVLSLLMVSRIPLLSLKFSNLKIKGNEGRYLLIALVLVSLVILGSKAFLLIIPLYLLASFLSVLFLLKMN
jgi:CDP-diacylglycerol---serine O-phosphatidyltransferase